MSYCGPSGKSLTGGCIDLSAIRLLVLRSFLNALANQPSSPSPTTYLRVLVPLAQLQSFPFASLPNSPRIAEGGKKGKDTRVSEKAKTSGYFQSQLSIHAAQASARAAR